MGRGGCRYFAEGLAGIVYLHETPMVGAERKNFANLHAYLPVNDPFETIFWTKLTKKKKDKLTKMYILMPTPPPPPSKANTSDKLRTNQTILRNWQRDCRILVTHDVLQLSRQTDTDKHILSLLIR